MTDEAIPEIITITEEDSEVELPQWRVDGLVEKLKEAEARILKADQQHHKRNAELEHLRGIIDRLTSHMTVAELRRVGVAVTLAYDDEEA